MDKFRCEHCDSADLIICQTISSGPIYYVCNNCKKEVVINAKLLNDMFDVYKQYLEKRSIKETAEEQGAIKCYL